MPVDQEVQRLLVRKHLQCISVISVKATVLEYMHQESKTKTTGFSLYVKRSVSQWETKVETAEEGKQKWGESIFFFLAFIFFYFNLYIYVQTPSRNWGN